jgi:hypothetical protein
MARVDTPRKTIGTPITARIFDRIFIWLLRDAVERRG